MSIFDYFRKRPKFEIPLDLLYLPDPHTPLTMLEKDMRMNYMNEILIPKLEKSLIKGKSEQCVTCYGQRNLTYIKHVVNKKTIKHGPFCVFCIEKWYVENGTCPICRRSIEDFTSFGRRKTRKSRF